MKAIDNNGREYPVRITENSVILNYADIAQDVEYIDITDDSFDACVGEDGYYVIADADKEGSRLCKFNAKANGERIFHQDLMPIFGIKKSNRCTLYIVTGLASAFNIVFGVKNDAYYIFPRFSFKDGRPLCAIKRL